MRKEREAREAREGKEAREAREGREGREGREKVRSLRPQEEGEMEVAELRALLESERRKCEERELEAQRADKMYRIDTLKNQNYKSKVQEAERFCEAARVRLTRRLIAQCTRGPTQTQATRRVPSSTTPTASVPTTSCCCRRGRWRTTPRRCSACLTQLHDLFRGNRFGQSHRDPALHAHPPPGMRTAAPPLLEGLSRLPAGNQPAPSQGSSMISYADGVDFREWLKCVLNE